MKIMYPSVKGSYENIYSHNKQSQTYNSNKFTNKLSTTALTPLSN